MPARAPANRPPTSRGTVTASSRRTARSSLRADASPTRRMRDGRCRSRSARRGPDAHDQLRGLAWRTTRGQLAYRAIDWELGVPASRCRSAGNRTFPFVPTDPADATSGARRCTTSSAAGCVKSLAGHRHRQGRARRLGRPRFGAGPPRRRAHNGRLGLPAFQRPRVTPCRDSPPAHDLAQLACAHGRTRRAQGRDRHPSVRVPDARATSAIPRRRRAGLRRDLRERAGRRAHSHCSGSPIITGRWWSAPVISPSWRSDGAPTASATRCRTTA